MITREDWVRITTNALEQWHRDMNHLRACSPAMDPEQAKKDLTEARRRYHDLILSTWQAYRPNGLLDGEELPNEVQALLEEQAREKAEASEL
jgi:hypothetical protein